MLSCLKGAGVPATNSELAGLRGLGFRVWGLGL